MLINPTGQAPADEAQSEGRTNMDEVDPVDGSTDDITTLFTDSTKVSFDDAINAIEQDVGLSLRGDEPEALADDTASPADDDTDADAAQAGDSASPDAASEPGDEQAPSADDTEGADEADDDAEDQPASPATAAADQVLSELTDEYDDFHAESVEDLAQQYRLEREGNEPLMEIFQDHEPVLEFVTAIAERKRAGEPVDLGTIAQEAFPEMQAPDPSEDPEGYREWANQQADRRAQRRAERQQVQQLQQELKQMRANAQEAASTAAAELDLDEDAARQEVATILNNPVDHNMPLLLLRGQRYEQAVAQARKEGKTEGRNAAIQELRQKREAPGDGIPAFSGTGTNGTPAEQTGENEELLDLASSLSGQNSDPLARIL